ncbi:MAG TPA: DUF4013 domain-containing protein [Caulifigura sp.]|nr:DUF4013 domain-containing protein [Caulifigura sp.]
MTELAGNAVLDDAIDDRAAAALPALIAGPDRRPALWKRSAWWLGRLIRTVWGIASVIVLLAVLAAVPLLNFAALGYLLAAEGRIARGGRLRDGIPLMEIAPRLGSIALGMWLWTLPLRFMAGSVADAALIDPGGGAERRLFIVQTILWAVISLHLILALARGGSLMCFFRPIKNGRWLWKRLRSGDYWSRAGQLVNDFIEPLKFGRHWWLGVRGFVVAMAWLLIPSALLSALRKLEPGQGLLTIGGGLLLVWVFSWVPFLQARFAAEESLRAGFELRKTRELWRHAPIAWLITCVVISVMSLPLYLFKVALPPADAIWFVTLIFMASILPTRILTGWAYRRAQWKLANGRRSHLLVRFGCRALLLPVLGLYVFLLFFTQFIDEHGKQALFEHHAFLLPWPG